MLGDRAQLIKTAMMLELSKEGKTLYDLETELNINIEKVALGDLGLGAAILKGPDILKSLVNILGGSAVVGGGALGVGAYGSYLQNEDSTNKKLKKLQEIKQYQNATSALKTEMQNPITL